jgi:hypothetical protein
MILAGIKATDTRPVRSLISVSRRKNKSGVLWGIMTGRDQQNGAAALLIGKIRQLPG